MDKIYLETCLNTAATDFIWTLYFFGSHKQRNAGYVYDSHKVRFTKDGDLRIYAQQVLNAVAKYQLNPISQVEGYNGLNTKCSCDLLSVSDEIIASNFTTFRDSLARATEADIRNRYKGYVLEGQPNQNTQGETVTFLKFANPTANLKSKKNVVFKKSDDNALDEVTEQFYKMYLTVDAILIGDNLYNFNHAFEKIFDVEQTLRNVKAKAIESIITAGIIANPDDFTAHAKSTNARTFVTLSDERIQRASNTENRLQISEILNVPLGSNGLFSLTDPEQTSRLLKYLCNKAIRDFETNKLFEVSNLSELNLGEPA